MVAELKNYSETFYDEAFICATRSAWEIVPILVQLTKISSVLDVGCGTGSWLSVFSNVGVPVVRGIDNASLEKARLQIPREFIIKQDLTQPFQIDQQFDLVMSLEVAEHLPESCARDMVTRLVSAGDLILFSAAIPHQGGTNHINEQWPEYWANLFAEHGYVPIDCLREQIWNNESVAYWLAQNLLFYVKKDRLDNYPKIAKYLHQTDPQRLTRIHPKTYVKNYKSMSSPQYAVMRFAWNMIPRWLRIRLVKPLLPLFWKQVSTKY